MLKTARIIVAVTVATLAGSTALHSQELQAFGGGRKIDHRLMHDPMPGGGIAIAWPFVANQAALQVSVERYGASSIGYGSTCAGLIEPGTCGPEPLRDRYRITGVTGTGLLKLFGNARFQASVLGDVEMAIASSKRNGLQSRRALDADAGLWGIGTGLRMRYSPFRTIPLSFDVNARAGVVRGISGGDAVDGYEPFSRDTYFSTRFGIGATYRVKMKR